MPIEGWCGKPCGSCESSCALDEQMPCSPNCENLNPDGTRNVAACNLSGCDACKLSIGDYVFDASCGEEGFVVGLPLDGKTACVQYLTSDGAEEDTADCNDLESAVDLRCSCVVHKEERIYIFVQAIPCVNENGQMRYRYSEVFLPLRGYAPDKLVGLLHKHGHRVSDFRTTEGGYIDWWQIAGIIAQSELKEPKNMCKPLLTFDEVRERIAKETKLDMSTCKPAARLQEEV